MFRDLRADEIECRVSRIVESKKTGKVGVVLLLYKDARADMNVLDDEVGPMNWQCRYSRNNANCEVGIYDPVKKDWIWKEDTGTESNTEAEKGLASDSFKRACFKWGIGRALYTAPLIWVDSTNCESLFQDNQNKWKCLDTFGVRLIDYEDGVISNLVIENKKHVVVYTYDKKGEYARGAQR